MLQELLNILPQALSTMAVAICIGGLIVGAMIWLIGARYSRMIIALSGVCAGGILGLFLPRWQNWPVSNMATSVAGAVVFGLFAFALHRLWIGVALGVVLAAWTALGTWTMLHGDTAWEPPQDTFAAAIKPLPQYVREEIWQRLPDDVRNKLPYTCGAALVLGLAIAGASEKLGRTMLFGALGVSALVGFGLTLVQARHADWLRLLPAPLMTQVALLLGLMLFGMIVQWQVVPARRDSAGAAPAEPQEQPAG